MVSPTRIYVPTEYGQMHLRIACPESQFAHPLVCLHMSPQSGLSFEEFMTLASYDRKIIAPDYHGYGGSSRPPQTPHVTIQDYARTIWQALDSIGVGQVDLLGHHTGSKVAVEMAYVRPESVKTLVLISANLLTRNEMQSHKGDFEPIPSDNECIRINKLFSEIRNLCGSETSANYLEKFLFQALQAGDAYQWGSRAAYEYNRLFSDVLSSIRHRTIVLNPNDDLYSVTPRIIKHLQNAVLIEKSHWNHGFLEFNTVEAVETILAALDSI